MYCWVAAKIFGPSSYSPCNGTFNTGITHLRPIFHFYSLWKMLEHQRFWYVFRGYRNEKFTWYGLITRSKNILMELQLQQKSIDTALLPLIRFHEAYRNEWVCLSNCIKPKNNYRLVLLFFFHLPLKILVLRRINDNSWKL